MFDYHFPHKICDSVHGFIRFDAIEKEVINSRPFQRLRYLHQMGPAYLVYPGATHSRFEHSLGVMELATRVYDTLMSPHNHSPLSEGSFDEIKISYGRRIIRLAALCHDMGHLPFSHTAEKELLPIGGHEKMTLSFIQSEELRTIWKKVGPTAERDILKLAVQEKELQELMPEVQLDEWERVLSSIITDDNFGVDRIDYLIRDAKHTGVGYGHFDYHQLIDTLRVLNPGKKGMLTIGITESGIQSVESLWIARYLMYARVYHHPKVSLFSHHLRRFMMNHYKKRGFSIALHDYLFQTDVQILAALMEAAKDNDRDAQVLLKQGEPYQEIHWEGFKEEELFSKLSTLRKKFQHTLFIEQHSPKIADRLFWVLSDEGNVLSSKTASPFLSEIPVGGKPLRLFGSQECIKAIQEILQMPDGSFQ